MKALSIRQPHASLVALGDKPIEWRLWHTTHRGALLICSSSAPSPPVDGVKLPCGYALAVGRLVDCRPCTADDLAGAWMDTLPSPRGWAWVFEDMREIRPQPISGKLKLFDAAVPIICLPINVTHLDYFNRFMI